MPRTTVYIRNDDWEKWKLIGNKSELISEAINRSVISAAGRQLEHHVQPPVEITSPVETPAPQKISEPTVADLRLMIKENGDRIKVLSESQDPDDQADAKELWEENEQLKSILGQRIAYEG